MNNQSSYCGLVDAKIRASDKDLPVKEKDIAGFIDAQKIEAFNYAFGVKISSRSSSKITFDIQNSTDGVVGTDVYQVVLRKNNPGFSLDSALLPSPNSLEPKVYNFKSTGKSFSEALILHQLTHNMTTDCTLNYKFNK